jgi:hypothetical protein
MSLQAVSFTDGDGPFGYTQLRPELIANTIGAADAGNLLPYLVGSARIAAHVYSDETLSDAIDILDVCVGVWTCRWLFGSQT